MADAEDQELNNNLQLINSELYSLVDSKEPHSTQNLSYNSSGASGVLQELNYKFQELELNSEAPEFEFHGYGCTQVLSKMPKRMLSVCSSGAKKKSRSNTAGNYQGQMVSRQKQMQLQKENKWNQRECGPVAMEKMRFCMHTEHNPVLNLMGLFESLHEHIYAELPSTQLNSVPSDYVFDLPMRWSFPKGLNVRHHIQVLCTKLDRFITRQRRILESNRHFDYTKYTECNELLIGVSCSLEALKQFKTIELRQRSLRFVSQAAKGNAISLEKLLILLRERIKSAHIHVHVFNWEMDLEHRYSAAMTERHEATNQRALELAAIELQGDKPLEFSCEEQLIANRYQLANIVSCAKNHEDFLTALLKSPENYFTPETIALCDPPQNGHNLSNHPSAGVDEDVESVEDLAFGGDILELAPSSPPRVNRTRTRIPKCFRA